jgi:RpiB/LacA/LacB family sugar-phosphate isomerase
MRLALAGDSAGAPLIAIVREHLKNRPELDVFDLSEPDHGKPELYAEMAARVAGSVAEHEYERAVLCCGTGIGVCISANKVPGIRAALTHDVYSAERATLSNDAQIITLGARVVGSELAKMIVDAWLRTRFNPEGPSAANVRAINAIDTTRSARA